MESEDKTKKAVLEEQRKFSKYMVQNNGNLYEQYWKISIIFSNLPLNRVQE